MTTKDVLVVDSLRVDQETVLDLQQGRGNPEVLVPEVIQEIEMQGTLVVVQGHVIDSLEGPALIVVTGPGIGEHSKGLIHAPDHVPEKEEEVIDLVHVPEKDTAKNSLY